MPAIDISRYPKRKVSPLKEAKTKGGLLSLLNKDISFGSKELSDKKKEYFYLELSSLLQAGINLKSGLELVTAEQKKPKDKALFEEIQASVLSGSVLSDALRRTGKFSLYEVFSLQIGEETGKINEVLTDLAKYYQSKIRQRRKIISALTYPVIVLSASLGAVFFMLKFIVPMFSDVFKRFGGELPWITQKIVFFSQALENHFLKVFVLVLILIVTGYALRNTEQFRRISSRVIMRLPLVGDLVHKIYLARFANSMRLLISAKLPLLKAVALSRQMIRYYPIETSLKEVEQNLMNGKPFYQSLQQFRVYPAKMVQLIKIGEETNKMDYFFAKVSEQYVEEVEYKTSALSSMMEPLIIIFLGLIVGVILVSMYLPLFQMSNGLG